MKNVKTDWKEGITAFSLEKGNVFQPDALRSAVKGAGFVATWIEFKATGQVLPEKEGIKLKLEGTEQVLEFKVNQKARELGGIPEVGKKSVTVVGRIPAGETKAEILQVKVN